MNSSLLIKTFIFFLFITSTSIPESTEKKNFQGKAYYFSKSTMNLGNWGARMSEAQKKTNNEPIKR